MLPVGCDGAPNAGAAGFAANGLLFVWPTDPNALPELLDEPAAANGFALELG